MIRPLILTGLGCTLLGMFISSYNSSEKTRRAIEDWERAHPPQKPVIVVMPPDDPEPVQVVVAAPKVDPELVRDTLRAHYWNEQREQWIRYVDNWNQSRLEYDRIQTDRLLRQQRTTYNINNW